MTPDDGMRYELLDGQLLVSPTPPTVHQAALVELAVQLAPACPAHLKVFVGPLEFRPSSRRVFLPDLLVVRREDVGPRWVEGSLVLAVEVLAPETRMVDELLKRRIYAEAGVASYWMVDPEHASLTVLELDGGTYVERAVVCGDEVFVAERPFPVKVVPGELSR